MNRYQFVLQHAAGKKVLHIGCVGNGQLHKALSEVAKELHGLDIDRAGLQQMPYGNLIECDAEDMGDLKGSWDVIVATEMLEHLSNPGLFLDGLRGLDASEILLTTPNALRRQLKERAYFEHVAYYSPQTLRRLLETHGFQIDELRPCSWNRLYGALDWWPLTFDIAVRCH